MKRYVCLFAVALVSACLLSSFSHAEDKKAPPEKRNEWMKQKLKLSQDILAGLTEADFDKIRTNAEALIAVDYLQKWLAPEKPQHVDYELQRANFEFYNRQLIRQAKDRNIDGAALTYHLMTSSCIECHKVVRDVKK